MRIRITLETKQTIRRVGTYEVDVTDEVAAKLAADANMADVWMRYTIGPMIPAANWQEKRPLTTGLGFATGGVEVVAAKWERIE